MKTGAKFTVIFLFPDENKKNGMILIIKISFFD